MAQVIKIDDNIVLVGLDDGSAIEVYKKEFNFEIHANMQIKVYKHNDKYIFAIDNTTTYEFEPEVEGKIYVDKVIYGLLYLFFGEIGVHAFYAKKPLYGCIFIATFFILLYEIIDSTHSLIFVMLLLAFLIGIKIYAIIILCKKVNRNGNILV